MGPSGVHEVTVAWMVLCESAFFDEANRLCMLGVARQFPVPALPLALVEHTLVAQLRWTQRPRAFDIAFGVRTPSGGWISPNGDDSADLRLVGDYVLVRLRSLPIREQGTYQFELSLMDGGSATLEVPVCLAPIQGELPGVH